MRKTELQLKSKTNLQNALTIFKGNKKITESINRAQKTNVNYGNPEVAYINSRNNYTAIIDDIDNFEKEFILIKKL